MKMMRIFQITSFVCFCFVGHVYATDSKEEAPEALWVNRINEAGEVTKVLVYLDRKNQRKVDLIDEAGTRSTPVGNKPQFSEFREYGEKVQVTIEGVKQEVTVKNPKKDKVINGKVILQKRSQSEEVLNPDSEENELLTNRMLEAIHSRAAKENK